MTIGKGIRKRRKELKMSVDELARRIGKDRSTVYRYENGDIGSMPVELLAPMIEALEITPQELFSSITTTNELFTKQAVAWFAATNFYEFNETEVELFHNMANYLIKIRHSEDYDENVNWLMGLFKQLNR